MQIKNPIKQSNILYFIGFILSYYFFILDSPNKNPIEVHIKSLNWVIEGISWFKLRIYIANIDIEHTIHIINATINCIELPSW